ncbi:MAG TPA: CHRD domain-containing protein [Actinomycetes bacterium]|nr:CHRD domain-containing protein [Actinomycetes bacterium]
MFRRVTMAAVVAVVAAAMAAPAALAQEDYSTSQVKYGDDVYGGTEGSTDSATSSAGQSGGGAWTKFSAKLTGSNEVGGGDPNGSGTAAVKVRGTEICFDLKWTGFEAIMSHIHKGAAGVNGDVVVPFFTSESPLAENSKSGCVTAKATVVKNIMANPGNYYVNVHSPEFPKGAARGQLVAGANADQLAFTGGPMSKGLMLLGLCVIAAGSTLLAVGQRRRVAYHRPRH